MITKRSKLGAAVAGVLALRATVATADTVRGEVILDRDRDGVRSAGDLPLAGVRVAFETVAFTTTRADGTFELEVPAAEGILWVSVPNQGQPGPAWTSIKSAGSATIVVRPAAESTSRFWFTLASDSHIGGPDPQWNRNDLVRVIRRATTAPVPARFFTILGDLTQRSAPEDFDELVRAVSEIEVPWVPVPGNHDWYDGGLEYRRRWGPDNYSFTTGGIHFVVWNSLMAAADTLAFIRQDLAGVPATTTVVVLAHIPPKDDVAAEMKAAGVDYLLTGHVHANRRIDRGGMVELGTQPLLTGGIDLSPAGYRIVNADAGKLSIIHRTVVDEPVLRLIWPAAGRCARPDQRLIASGETGSLRSEVTARVDGHPLPLSKPGGWTWVGSLSGLADGPHEITLLLDGGPEVIERRATVRICDDAVADPGSEGEWLQFQGDPGHRGQTDRSIDPPLVPVWAAAVGGHLGLGGAISAEGRVFVSTSDMDDGAHGGVAAFELRSGSPLWRFSIPVPVRHAPAVIGDTVIAATTTAMVYGIDATTGTKKWSIDLAAGFDANEISLWAPPTVAGDLVYIGHQHRVVALEGATGVVRWSASPSSTDDIFGTTSPLAVDGPDLVGAFHRISGLSAWHPPETEPRWRVEGPAAYAVSGILIDGEDVYVGTGAGAVSAYERATGRLRWTTTLATAGEWGFVGGTPALAERRLFVPLHRDRLVALDADTGDVLWSYQARVGPIRAAHLRGRQAGFQGGPLVAGDLVWIADTSGLLVALDAQTGAVRAQHDLGVPSLGGLAVAGDYLLVTTWDGTLHAFAPMAQPAHRRSAWLWWLAIPIVVVLAVSARAVHRRIR